MLGRSSSRLLFSVAFGAVFCVGWVQSVCAQPAIRIPTNAGGADTEVREFQIISDPFNATPNLVIPNAQFGNSVEIATRAQDDGVEANNSDRSSMMYFKFDISSLPDHNTVPGALWWLNKKVFFEGRGRNNSNTSGRLYYPTTGDPAVKLKMELRGLEPGNVYADDVGGSTTRTDRSGNDYQSPNYKYNWDEGTGNAGIVGGVADGIWFGDTPGLTPHCMIGGSCDTLEYAGTGDPDVTANNIYQGLGQYDDFNSDARPLGDWLWPKPQEFSAGSNRYPVGIYLRYKDWNGNLKELVFDAQDAGRDHVTVIMNMGMDPLDDANGGTFPDNTFRNFNYLFVPKEMTVMNNDTNWDPDGGSGPIGTIGSPYSCSNANCNGDGSPFGDDVLRTLGSNADGSWSTALIIDVPEPASVMLLVIGMLGALGMTRRRAA